MTRPEPLTGLQRDELLAESAQQHTQLTLTTKASGRWRTYKSTMLDITRGKRALVVSYPIVKDGESPEFIPGEQIGVTFRHRNRKLLFSAVVFGRGPESEGSPCSGDPTPLLLTWPAQIEQLQRRAYHRVEIPRESPVAIRLWRGSLGPDGGIVPAPSRGVLGRLLDLSVGGVRVEVAEADDPSLEPNDAAVVEFAPEPHQPSITAEVCFRHVQPSSPGWLSLGFQFIGLEVTPNGQAVLARLARTVSRLQRNGPRHARLTQ